MIQDLTVAPAELRSLLLAQAVNLNNPAWMRVALWCYASADHNGHARAYRGQVAREARITTKQDVTKALAIARDRGLIDQCSSAVCLVVPGHGLARCDATHRGQQ